MSNNTFDSDAFYKKMEDIAVITKSRLQMRYPDSVIEVKINKNTGKKRDLEKQNELYVSGASKSSIGLHNFGAAADFDITINNNYQHGEDYETQLPYRVLGSVAKEFGYFWGWGGDSRHVAETRFVDQFLRKHPGEAENDAVKEWYFLNNDTTMSGYKPTMELLDSIYSANYFWKPNPDRVYKGEERTIDKLLEGINEKNILNKRVFGFIK